MTPSPSLYTITKTHPVISEGFVLKLNDAFSVELEAIPPYSFELTLRKPAGWYWSTPQEVWENGVCWSAARFNGELLGLKLHSSGTTRKPRIHCQVYSRAKLGGSTKQAITQMLRRALKTEEDLTEFYRLSQKDTLLQGVVGDLYGMHTVGWPELFPALILAVSLQMAPMKRSNQMMELLMANCTLILIVLILKKGVNLSLHQRQRQPVFRWVLRGSG